MDGKMDGDRLEVKPYRLLLALPPLLFLGVFYFYPLVKIMGLSLTPVGGQAWAPFAALFSKSYYLQTLWFTTWQAALSTMLSVLLALPGAYVFARYTFPGKELIKALTTVPFILPTVVVAAAFRALLGPHGLANDLLMKAFQLEAPPIRIDQTVWFFLLAHVFYNYTVVLRIVSGFWANLQPELTEAARMLGASSWQAFRKVTLPLLIPALLASSLLVFIFCFTSFGVVLILGGPRLATLEVEIYRQAMHLFNLPMAAALSLLQIVFTFALMWIYTWLQRKTSRQLTPESALSNLKPLRRSRAKIMVTINVVFMVILLCSPIAALVLKSFSTADGWSMLYYQSLFFSTDRQISFLSPWQAMANSLTFAGMTMVVTIGLGFMAAWTLSKRTGKLVSILDPVFMLPLSTSAVTLGFGFVVALNKPPLNLRTSIALVPLAHSLVALPFVIRSILPALRSIPENLREAAALLGATPWRVWLSVDLPIVGRAVIVAMVFAFAVSLGEFGASLFVARPETPTMPLAIYRLLSQPGSLNYGQAMAMSTLLILVTSVSFLWLEKVRIGQVGEF
jgi:thiamine transport system permease protein